MAHSNNNILNIPSLAINTNSHGNKVSAKKQAKTLAITSGKGGVGKSNITTNLAIVLAQQGAKVCIFDADTSLANVNILMGLHPQYNIEHLLDGTKTIDEILITGPASISIVPASSGLANIGEINEKQQNKLIHALETLEQRFDYLLIDTAAGIGSNVTRFLRAAHSILLVISTEPTSLTDAFALLRVLKRNGYTQTPNVLVNMAINYANGMEVYKRFDGAVKKYLKLNTNYIGYITDDIAVKESVRHQCPVVLYRPNSLATHCFNDLKKVLSNRLSDSYRRNKFSTFWKMLLTSESNDIHAADVASMLKNKTRNPAEEQQRILSYIGSSNLDSNQLLPIMQSLANALFTDKKENNSKEFHEKLKKLIQKLQGIEHSDNAEEKKLKDSAMRLTKSSEALEIQLDKLNEELNKFIQQ